jgi:predicted TIM-barrel fold metal-dependent hydrolase
LELQREDAESGEIGGKINMLDQDGAKDKFVEIASAAVEVDLPLGAFRPRSSLKTPVHSIEKPRFPVIDYHNHLDSQRPSDLLKVMDACDVEILVNITMQVGQTALEGMDRLHQSAPDRFSTIGWMDWTGIDRDDFAEVSCQRLQRMADHGACGLKFWKDFGLTIRKGNGEILRIDDERLAPIFEKATELDLPVMFHTADPDAFFEPIDAHNERYEELAAHPDWDFHGSSTSKRELLEQRNRVFARHPETTFVGAHLAECGEDLAYLSELLDTYPNLQIDISARTPELGRQPYSARRFLLKYADRILFGTDLLPEVSMYRLHYRFLETSDEYFEYPSHASRQGRWNIYGLFLPDDVLRKVYRENALKLLCKVR